MNIEGKIVSVMESWPLELVIETLTDRYNVQLLLETSITKEDQKVDLRELKSGIQVRIEGNRVNGSHGGITAEAIEII